MNTTDSNHKEPSWKQECLAWLKAAMAELKDFLCSVAIYALLFCTLTYIFVEIFLWLFNAVKQSVIGG